MEEDIAEEEKRSGDVADQEETEQPIDESAESNGKNLIQLWKLRFFCNMYT